MSKIDGKTAKRYARSLFETVEPAKLEAISEALQTFANAWADSPELRAAMLSPKISKDEKLNVISDIAKSISSESTFFLNFLSLLQVNKRLGGIKDIHEEFRALVDELRNRIAMEISSAYPIPHSEQEDIEKNVQETFGSLSSIEWKTDPELLGGLYIKVGDKVLDSSVRGGLNRAKAQLVA